MFDEIQKAIFPNYLSSFEKINIEKLKQTYTEEEIIQAYKTYGLKPIEYIKKVLETKKNKKKVPSWLEKEIINEELDNETINTFNEFNSFLEEFRK